MALAIASPNNFQTLRDILRKDDDLPAHDLIWNGLEAAAESLGLEDKAPPKPRPKELGLST